MDRRSALRTLAASGVAAAAARLPAGAAAAAPPAPPADAAALLYDATKCIGCQACVAACRVANGLEADGSGLPGGLWHAPADLGERAKTVVRLAKGGSGTQFWKSQCMHCVDPACVAACMIGALQKRERGAVTWEGDRCIGCRYCAQVCPFDVPKFEWSKAAPKLVKCELCSHRWKDGKGAACAEVCPRGAVLFGNRTELLAEAERRLAEHPEAYVPKVYGATDAGGTQVLCLSRLPFRDVGMPDVASSVPATARTIQHGIYQGMVAPAALYAVLAGVVWRNRRTGSPSGEEGENR